MISGLIIQKGHMYMHDNTFNPSACLEKAFCKMYVTICGRLGPIKAA